MSRLPLPPSPTDGAARTGVIATPHGDIRTPAFMPVGTAGTVKALTVDQVRATGAEILLGNTYHLMLRPAAERVAALGGLHKFMRWARPILTDSGGFQVMSLCQDAQGRPRTASTFQSHIDGSRHVLTPERSIEIQATCWAPTSPCSSTNASPAGRARASRARHAAVAALGASAASALSARARARRCSASSRAATFRRCAREARARSIEIGFRRLCHRRAGGRRGAGGHVRGAGLRACRCCRPTGRAI